MQGSEGLLDYNFETEVKNEESLHEDDFNSLPLAELRSFLLLTKFVNKQAVYFVDINQIPNFSLSGGLGFGRNCFFKFQFSSTKL